MLVPPARRALAALLPLICACQPLVLPPPPRELFLEGRVPPPEPAQTAAPWWIFLGGLALGILLAWAWRRFRLRQAQKRPGALLLPPDLDRLEAAAALMEEVVLAGRRRSKLVRLKSWRPRRGR